MERVMPMKRLFLLSALLLTPAHAVTVNDTFTCVGTLTSKGLNPGFYQIVAAGDADYPMTCLLDDASKASTKRILAVCHEGDTCIVRASGQSGNANIHSIDKVLSVRRAPKSISPALAQDRGALSDFIGVWVRGDADNNKCKAEDWKKHENDGLINVSSSSVEYWESGCKIISVKRSTSNQYDSTVNVQLACGGEGLTWRSREIWAVQTIDNRKMFVATTVSTSDERDDSGRRTNTTGPSVAIYLQCR
jgi:hypothetical protein